MGPGIYLQNHGPVPARKKRLKEINYPFESEAEENGILFKVVAVLAVV